MSKIYVITINVSKTKHLSIKNNYNINLKTFKISSQKYESVENELRTFSKQS